MEKLSSKQVVAIVAAFSIALGALGVVVSTDEYHKAVEATIQDAGATRQVLTDMASLEAIAPGKPGTMEMNLELGARISPTDVQFIGDGFTVDAIEHVDKPIRVLAKPEGGTIEMPSSTHVIVHVTNGSDAAAYARAFVYLTPPGDAGP